VAACALGGAGGGALPPFWACLTAAISTYPVGLFNYLFNNITLAFEDEVL
jgi:hypothetical protein